MVCLGKRQLVAVLCVTVFTQWFPLPGFGQQFPVPPQTSPPTTSPPIEPAPAALTSLVQEALAANPELTVLRREFDAARARVPQAKALPDPMVMFGNNTQGTALPLAGLKGDFSELYLGVTQEVPWFGIRRLRGQVASAEVEAKFQEYETARRRVAAEVKAAVVELYGLDHTLAVVRRDREILEKFRQVAEARYSVGKAQQADVINANVEITELLEQEAMIEANREGVTARLNTLLLRPPETPVVLAEIQLSPTPPALDELVRLAWDNAPDIKQRRRMIEAGNHAIRLAEREAKYPEVGFNFTYHNRPAFPDYYTYGVTLRLPFYAFTKQRYAVAERTAELSAARARLTTTEALVRYRLRDAHVRATTAARLLKLTSEGLLPQTTLALESVLAAYQVGQVDFLTLLTALKRAVDVETRYWERRTDYHKALAEMEALAGIELIEPGGNGNVKP